MPGFDPNEPRDAFGKWVENFSTRAKAATHKAASDKKTIQQMAEENAKQGEQLKTILQDQKDKAKSINEAEDAIKGYLGYTERIQLEGLSVNEANDVVDVIKDITNDGTVKIPVDTVYVCSGEYNSLCQENSDAGAFYNFNFEAKKGSLYINPAGIKETFGYNPNIPTYDEKLEKVNGVLKNLNDSDYVINNMISKRDLKINLDHFEAMQKTMIEAKLNKLAEIPNNASIPIKNDDERFKAIVYHEMGHMVLKKDYFDTHPKVHLGEEAYTGYLLWRNTNVPVVKPNSEYGRTSSDEYFAEWYGQYKVGRVKADELPKEVKTIVDRNPL